ncbi:hypothetical protein JCM19232_4269 [Vibrio ishigakensis]|uniref:NmrA-like domain-containing protein n=1 Tax=Vibrio ishigakensis TaxID=1481914 RepID=A0A0B8PRL5_9VIBR|nr:hypothetical protein JCM19232_4269 [Vibrio ishigakensis]
MESLHEELFHNGTIETRQIREAGMKHIQDSGIPYTFFYCSFFADSFTRFIDNNQVYLFGELTHEVYFTNSLQLAQHIYQAINNPLALNQKYAVQGTEGLTFYDAAKRFFSEYDTKVSVETLPISTIDELGLDSSEAGFLKRIWEVCEGLDERFVSAETYQHLGEPQINLSTFANALKSDLHT